MLGLERRVGVQNKQSREGGKEYSGRDKDIGNIMEVKLCFVDIFNK